MADDGVLVLAEWWALGDGGGERVALEVKRSDKDEVLVTVQGLAGTDGPGSLYVTATNAAALVDLLKAEAAKKWEPRG